MMKKTALIVCFLLSLVLISPTTQAQKKSKQPLNILMIGNSYSARLNKVLPPMFKADTQFNTHIKFITPGGRRLVQHVTNPKTLEAIKSKDQRWHVVVLQDQSQTPGLAMAKGGEALKALEQGGPALIRLIRKHQPQAKIILYATWARHKTPDKFQTLKKMFDNDPKVMLKHTTAGYERILKKEGQGGWDFSKHTRLARVGEAWMQWYDKVGYENQSLSLHSKDSSHQSHLGAYFASAVLYAAATGKDVRQLKYDAGIKTKYQGKLVTHHLKNIAHQIEARSKPKKTARAK